MDIGNFTAEDLRKAGARYMLGAILDQSAYTLESLSSAPEVQARLDAGFAESLAETRATLEKATGHRSVARHESRSATGARERAVKSLRECFRATASLAGQARSRGLAVPAFLARSGGANDAGVPEFMDFVMADPAEEARAREWRQTSMRGGLAWIDVECRERFGHDFVSCTEAERTALLDEIAYEKDGADGALDEPPSGKSASGTPYAKLKPLDVVPPLDPPRCRRLGIEGIVRVRVLVGEHGRPLEVLVGHSSGDASLDDAALDAVRRWRFEPARRDGAPVRVWAIVPIEFRLVD
jgi:TonB family protein